ncbi:MAG: hypothetical protein IJ733_15755 [Lachnospiraceae bacterium]|nr:hypothetical protein [Lachnospiraceae bacterium]
MLGKLFLYDMKNQLRIWRFAYIGILGFSLLTALIRCLDFKKGVLGEIWGAVYGVSKGFFYAAGAVMIFATLFYAVLYFRNNLLKDQGYLMHTLPVKESELFLSKFLSSWCCILLSILVFAAGIVITRFGTGDLFSIIYTENGVAKRISLSMLFFGEGYETPRLLFLVIFFAIPVNLSLFLFSLTLGYTMKQSKRRMNRDVLSVLVYIGTYAGQQFLGVISLILGALLYFRHYGTKSFMEQILSEQGPTAQLPMDYFITVAVGIDGILIIGLAVAAVFWSIYRLKKYLNLE